jgi:hypothetical protein
MSKKPKKLTYQQQKRRKKQRAKIKKGPTITINRIKRVLQPKVPDDIDLEKLAELYRLEGIRKGIQLVTMMPQQLIDAVVRGDMPTHVETIVLLKKIKEGIESGHREALDHLEKMQTDLESLVRPHHHDSQEGGGRLLRRAGSSSPRHREHQE